jgi:hypothetical protein
MFLAIAPGEFTPRKRHARGRRVARGPFALLCCLLLAACGAGSGQKAGLATSSQPPAIAALPGVQSAASAAPPAPQAVFPLTTASLVGKSVKDIVGLYGSPHLKLREPTAEIWQYRKAGCVLEMVMVGDQASAKVTYVEVRSRKSGVSAESCSPIVGELARSVVAPPQGA